MLAPARLLPLCFTGPLNCAAVSSCSIIGIRHKSTYRVGAGRPGSWASWLLGIRPFLGGASAATVAMLAAGVFSGAMGRDTTCLADSASGSGADASEDVEKLENWLLGQGADLGCLQIRKSEALAGGDNGYGIFLTTDPKAAKSALHKPSWWWPFGGSSAPLAQFPLSSAITAGNIMKDPELGRGYGWMLGQGLLDERTIIISYLAVHKAKGSASPLAPWVHALPKTFHTPLYYTPGEMQELRGTTLSLASASILNRLREQWHKVEPSLTIIATQGKASAPAARAPTFDDMLWAHSVFWSRGQSLPIPHEGPASKTVSASKHNEGSAALQIVDAIVPGLDFANHHITSPQCWWEVVAPAKSKPSAKDSEAAADQQQPAAAEADTTVVQLRLHKGVKVTAGQELMISYGGKSNEELLMLYGFAAQENPHDALMLPCPIPPSSQWDEVMHTRMRLMRALGMQPQIFLHASGLPSSSSSAAGKSDKGCRPSVLPQQVLDMLEIFVLDVKELNARMQVLQNRDRGLTEGGSQGISGHGLQLETVDRAANVPLLSPDEIMNQKAKMSQHELHAHSRRMGLRMGTLTTLVRILEMHVIGLEGEEGTGTLEQDEALLAKGSGSMEHRKWTCVVYRHGQKRITREYLAHARVELKDIIQLMRTLEDMRKGAAS